MATCGSNYASAERTSVKNRREEASARRQGTIASSIARVFVLRVVPKQAMRCPARCSRQEYLRVKCAGCYRETSRYRISWFKPTDFFPDRGRRRKIVSGGIDAAGNHGKATNSRN